jgi:hypothetical protein
MPAYNAAAFFFDFLVSLVIILIIYKLIGPSLRELLDKVVRIPAGTSFYMRALLLVLFCTALSKVVSGIHQKPEAHFMEYVWAVATDISGVFDSLILIILVYVAVVTILVVVLKPKNE